MNARPPTPNPDPLGLRAPGRRALALGLLTLLGLGCAGRERASDPSLDPSLARSASASGADRTAGAPPPRAALLEGQAVQPQLATLPDGQLVGTWAMIDADGRADIAFAELDASSGEWSPPRRVNPTPGSAVAGRQVGPRLAVLPGGAVIIVWVDRSRDLAGDLFAAVTHDRGATFSAPRRVNDDPGAETGQEYHDVTVAPDGAIHVVWLDERRAPADSPNEKQLFHAVSRDGGRSFGRNVALTRSREGVCPCCRPAIAASADRVHVVYRERVEGELFIRYRGLSETGELSLAQSLSEGWDFPGCPVNGPAIAARGTELWILWVERGRLGWTHSRDDGQSFRPPPPVAAGTFAFPGAEREPQGGDLAEASGLGLELGSQGAFASWADSTGAVFVAPLDRAARAALETSGAQSSDAATVWPWRIPPGERALAHSPSLALNAEGLTLSWVEEPIVFDPSATTRTQARPELARRPWRCAQDRARAGESGTEGGGGVAWRLRPGSSR